MSTCPICDAITSDPCGMGGAGDGPLPDWVKEHNKEHYIVTANEGDVDHWNCFEGDNKRKVHSYSIERRYIMCDTCNMMRTLAIHHPDRLSKIIKQYEVRASLEKSLKEHRDIWKELA